MWNKIKNKIVESLEEINWTAALITLAILIIVPMFIWLVNPMNVLIFVLAICSIVIGLIFAAFMLVIIGAVIEALYKWVDRMLAKMKK